MDQSGGPGPTIRKYRKLRGLTLKELADAVGRSESHISRLERDSANTDGPYRGGRDMANLREIFRVLDIPIEEQHQAMGL